MISAITPSIFSVDFSLSALMLPAGSVRMNILSAIQRMTGCPPCAIFFSKVSFISSLVGGLISLKPCPNGTTAKHSFEILHHLHCTPAVKGNLADVVLLTQFLDERLDKSTVNLRDLDGFFFRQLRQNRRHPTCRHRFAPAGHTDHEDIMPSRRCNLKRRLRLILSLHIRKVMVKAASFFCSAGCDSEGVSAFHI